MMGKWINLDLIDVVKFRKPDGYTPEGHFTNIQYHRDAQFIFPTRYIQPLNWSLMDNEDACKFFNGHPEFGIPEGVEVRWVNKYAFIPGPGEIRPTHVLWRYDAFPREPMPTPAVFRGDYDAFRKEYRGDDFTFPLKQVVLKAVNPKYGYQEFRKQRKLVGEGFPTPRVYHYETYFSPIMLGLVNIINQPRHPLQKQCRWAYDLINKLEHDEKTFAEFEEETHRFRVLLGALEAGDEYLRDHKQARKNLARYIDDFEDVNALTDGGRKALKGYFTMDYWPGLVSFERILFDLLGGRKLETYSRSIRLLDRPPVFRGPEVAREVVDVVNRLWSMGETHNDLKGEHVVFDEKTGLWGMIDWGELTPGSPGKDLALFLKDSADFIRHRVLFNRRYLRKTFRDKWGEKFDASSPHYHKARLNFERVTRDIFHNEALFWRFFLREMAARVGAQVLRDAAEIGQSRNLTFNWEFVLEVAGEGNA
ncbi:MAG: phosphotransferase [Promethearchaeota archaeon]